MLPASSAPPESAGTVMAMITTPDEALARTEWMLAAGYVSQNPCKIAGSAAALARVPSTLGFDHEDAEAIAAALADVIVAMPVERG